MGCTRDIKDEDNLERDHPTFMAERKNDDYDRIL